MLRILFVIPYFAPAWGHGGPARLAFDYTKELVKRGHKVTVYASDTLDGGSRIKKKHAFLDGIEVFYLPNLSNFLAWRKIFLPYTFPKLLGRTIKNFDVAHCFDFRTFQNIWVYYYARKFKVPYVISILGQIRRGLGVRRPIKALYDSLWGGKVLEGASLIFAQNDHEKEDLKEFGLDEGKIAMLPLAINFSEFKTLPDKGAFRQKYGIKENEFLILFLGRIHYLKGIDFLINALPGVRKKIKNARLAIVGRDDGYLNALRSLAEKRRLEDAVIFTDPLYGKERIAAYRDADVFAITPRFSEETSLASLEAAACGTPIIVNQRCQVPYLEDYHSGIAIPEDTPEHFAKAVFQILEKKGKVGEMARKMVQEKFALGKVVREMGKIYCKVLEESRVGVPR